jgi:hypothetical protein
MTSSRYLTRIGCNLMTICVLGGLLTACNTLGPSAIRSGRLDYNQAITETNNQQMLMAIVHNRYEELGSLLSVASITANVRITAGTELQLGFGGGDNYSGNLVPFSASTVYEENPTISYTPVTGEKYATQLMSPLPVSSLAQFAGTLTNPAPIYTVLISSVNGIYNPDFLFSSMEPDPRFSRFVAIMTALTRMHRLHWVEDPLHTGKFSVVIHHYAPTYTAEVNELLQMLGLPAPKDHSATLVLPVSQALDGRDAGGIGITTRSVYRLVDILSAAVELPEQDQGSGVTADYPPPGPVGQALRVHYAKTRPDNAAVVVQYRGGWFYIDDKDQATKGYFRLLGTLWSVKIAESGGKSPVAPVLTIPVSR